MRNFIYKNSNRSGIGDRLFDLMLVYTYCKYLKCDKLYLHWDENNSVTIGNGESIYSKLRIEKTPFRFKDYLLKNLIKYINLPEDIVFVNKSELNDLCNDDNNIVFTEYIGISYNLYSFLPRISNENWKLFEKLYFDNFSKISFKNIPENIVDFFKNNKVITVHLRRGDKVCNDKGKSNNIELNELDKLNQLTEKAIFELNNDNAYKLCFISDENSIKYEYFKNFKDKLDSYIFEGNEISQTYIDLFCLVNSEKIIMSQKFSVFSIFSSMIKQNKLYCLINQGKIREFNKYKNIILT